MEKNMDMEKDTDMEKDVEKKKTIGLLGVIAIIFVFFFALETLDSKPRSSFNSSSYNSSVASEKHTSSNSFYNSSFSSVYKDCIARCGENYKKDRTRCLLYYVEGVDLITKGKPSYYNIDMVVMATEDCLIQAEIKLLDCHRNCRSGF